MKTIEIDDLNFDPEAKFQYEYLVAQGIQAIKNEEFKKVVLSRKVVVPVKMDFEATFLRLLQSYKESRSVERILRKCYFIFMCHSVFSFHQFKICRIIFIGYNIKMVSKMRHRIFQSACSFLENGKALGQPF